MEKVLNLEESDYSEDTIDIILDEIEEEVFTNDTIDDIIDIKDNEIEDIIA